MKLKAVLSGVENFNILKPNACDVFAVKCCLHLDEFYFSCSLTLWDNMFSVFSDISSIKIIAFKTIHYQRLIFEVLNVILEKKQFLYRHYGLINEYKVDFEISILDQFLQNSFKFITPLTHIRQLDKPFNLFRIKFLAIW